MQLGFFHEPHLLIRRLSATIHAATSVAEEVVDMRGGGGGGGLTRGEMN